MKKISEKLLKIVMLISMIFSSFQTPIYVLANELTDNSSSTTTTPEKGDMKLGKNGEITKEGTVSVISKSNNEKIEVKKTVTADKTTEGKYRVDFEITGKESETETPVYIVLVFDTSGSMCDVNQYSGKCRNMNKWNNAVNGAQDFAKTIIDSLPKSKIALVTFDTNATKARGFEHSYLGTEADKTIFGTAGGGTNLHEGLIKAQEYLTSGITEEDKATAKKYVVVMSDGQPTYYISDSGSVKGDGSSTNKTTLDKTLTTANSIKTSGTEIYSIGYALPTGKVYNSNYTWNNKTYYGLTAKEILQLVASVDTEEDIKANTQHYQDASSEETIIEVFKKIAKNITLPGKKATLTDNIGSNFKFIQEQDNTPGGTATPGTNGFGGKYITNQITEITKNKVTISFDIEINKDAPTGWHQTNAGFALEYTDPSGEKQTITSNEDPYVYWVQAKYDYVVNYYKDSIEQNNLLTTETRQAPAGTIINESNVEINKYINQLSSSYEYSSLTPESITITNDGETKTINVLYVKVYGDLVVKHIDEEGNDLLPSTTTTKEINTNYTTKVEDIYGYTSTGIPSNANGIYKKGTTTVTYVYSKNEGSIEDVENNDVVKTQINPIIGANSTFKYVLTYNGKVKDYIGTATVTLTDTLPYEVSNIKYDENVCTYNETSRLLTCTKTVELNENNQLIEARFEIEVTYKNLVNTTNLNVLNKVSSSLTFGQTEVTDNSEVTDVIKSGTVIATYVDKDNNELAPTVTTTGLIDNEYKTNEKPIYGYTLKEINGKETGLYTEETIEVIYVYTKNEGTIELNEVTKVGPENITSIDGTFNYTLTYNGKVKDYVGNATLTLKDELPYEIDESKSSFAGCTYENKVITCTKEYTIDENNQEITAEYNLSLVFKNIDSEKVINKVESILDYGQETPDKDTDETETEVFKGTVIATYVDEENNQLTDSETTNDLAGTDYKTTEKTIYGYTLKEVIGKETGKYIANETIEVIYVYTKNEGTIENNDVVKTQINPIIGVNSTFNYILTYNGKVNNYLGTATVTLKDTLPYEVLNIEYNEKECTYNEETRLLTCTKTVELNENNQLIEARFDIKVTYKNLVSPTNLNILNKVESTLTFGQTEVTDTSEVADTILSGKVTALYVDEENNELADSVITTGLIDTNYETTEKTIYGYTLKEVIGNETGTYTKEDIEVIYVYNKNEGTINENEVNKVQNNQILGTNSSFEYVITYNGKIENYVGTATVILKDTLPYEVLNIEYNEEECTYNKETRLLTCTKTAEITETNNKINANFKIVVTYKNLNSTIDLEITNKVESTLTFGKTEVTDTSEVTDTILSGKVTALYVDEENNELADSVITTGLIDTNYETTEKTIYGYTLKEVIGNETGTYTKEDIEVIYVYNKNEGTTETNEVIKVGPKNITSVNGIFNYTLTYQGKITDYVGKATLTLTDTLPYEIDEQKSSFAGCTHENKVITCIKEYDINENNQEINEAFNLSLVFKNINSEKVINKVESILDYGQETPDKDTDETETEVFKGTVIVTYKNKQGETLTENIVKEDFAGNNYETESLEFLGYTLSKLPENKSGVYVANQTIYVNYIYDKNIGTSEEHLEKQGMDKVININSPFEYKITYNLKIFDYVGEVKITLTDYLPYEIDEEKSIIGDVCKYTDGKLICEYLQTITNKDNSKISIEENLVLYYKNITSNKVTNKIESLVVYDETEKKDEDEFTTEISYGSLKVNYITEDGVKLSQTTITTDLVGKNYTTEEKVFDNYYLKEVIGETEGIYSEEETEVTYVYSLIPLPPQTGVENNSINYLGLLIFATMILILKRKYL